ncbi:MAG: trypsin-like peptidase domain-containing protein [Oscillospiraceae bacterium]
MNSSNKKRRWPIAALMLGVVCISLFGGIYLGKYYTDSRLLNSVKGYFNINPSNTSKDSEAIIELKPIPEVGDTGYGTTEIYDKVNPSVVNINVYAGNSVSPMSKGTGIIMNKDGYIITNAHVVSGGNSVNVIFYDGTQARGTIVGADVETDLAVIKVEKSGLSPAEFGDSNLVKIGERAIVIGNAGGLSSTLTQGVVSGLDRDLDRGSRSLKLIQIDAAINPGNSGGPLVNRYGQVIGITSSKIASLDYEGIGFAIPITGALPVIESIIKYGYVTGRAVLGVQIIELNDSNGPANGLPDKGAYIASINEGSDLIKKGVRERDVIIEANGVEIKNTDILLTELEKYSPGDIFNMKIYRADTDQTFSVDVILSESK